MKLAYKNIGKVTKTFYGVEFKPGATKEVEGYINAPTFIRVDKVSEDVPKSTKPQDAPAESKPAPKVESKKPTTPDKPASDKPAADTPAESK